jgi:flagellar basal-body rod protein FlgC
MSDRIISHFDVSASALTAERARMRVIASNVANVNTTRTAEGGPYQKQFAVLEAQKVGGNNYETGVRISQVVTDTIAPRMVYSPEHPDANPEGYVAYPNVDILEEVANMKTATLAYQANLSILAGTKQMVTQSLRIGE